MTAIHFLRVAAAIVALAFAGVPSAIAGQAQVHAGAIPGVAINGYDPVAYFTENKPVEGSAAITTTWNGATWRFASAANRDAFVADPEKYAPQYGGYCAWAVSNGYTAGTDPRAFSISGGKLYLNYSRSVQARWAKDISGNVSKADANWPGVLE
ncbi:MAG: YHS domain-containing protein [Nitratireductor sp.]|nr:YHS domain-containing protein [Nitratireductor sp.]